MPHIQPFEQNLRTRDKANKQPFCNTPQEISKCFKATWTSITVPICQPPNILLRCPPSCQMNPSLPFCWWRPPPEPTSSPDPSNMTPIRIPLVRSPHLTANARSGTHIFQMNTSTTPITRYTRSPLNNMYTSGHVPAPRVDWTVVTTPTCCSSLRPHLV